jgi:hypothetical protein
MTARLCNRDQVDQLQAYTRAGAASPIKVNKGVDGIIMRLDPQNFLDKKKNELGLHDLSAVLLRTGKALSKQLFTKRDAYAVFMPIPLEEDLQLFEELSQAAKRNRAGALYQFVVTKRAEFTRIKYGSDNDMAIGFLNVTKGDTKQHIRYGEAMRHGGAINEELLPRQAQRTVRVVKIERSTIDCERV